MRIMRLEAHQKHHRVNQIPAAKSSWGNKADKIKLLSGALEHYYSRMAPHKATQECIETVVQSWEEVDELELEMED